MMVHIADAVDDRVAHVEVAGGKVDLGAKRLAALGEFAVFHALEQVEILLDRTIAVGRDSGLADIAAVFPRLLRRQVADIREALFDQLHGVFIVLFKIIRAVEKAVAPVEAQPVDILLDGVHIFGVLLGRIGVVHAEVAQAAEFFSRAEIDGQRLAVADVQIAVRLRRKTGVDLLALKLSARRDVFQNKCVNEIFRFHDPAFFFHESRPFSL